MVVQPPVSAQNKNRTSSYQIYSHPMRQSIKKYTPRSVWQLGSNTYWWWRNRGRHVLARSVSPRWAESKRNLRQLENIHKDKRCFIIGNGPSLRKTDLTKLRGEFTFGLNRIYLLFPELGFTTTYLVSVNDLVLEQCAAEMKTLKSAKISNLAFPPLVPR